MSFYINILTPEKQIFEGDLSSLIVPAALGYLGVLSNHAPLVANLIPGNIIYKEAQGLQGIIKNAGKGFIEVVKNNAVILLDSVG
jgi:F-type H+-transporting ATPase subunit epsilon